MIEQAGVGGMASLTTAIRTALDVEPGCKALDLHALTRELHQFFPHLRFEELALEIAHVAVAEGCRYLIWEPPAN